MGRPASKSFSTNPVLHRPLQHSTYAAHALEGDSILQDRQGVADPEMTAGFASVGGVAFVLWIATYAITGLLVGERLGHPFLMAGLGAAVGLCPSAAISIRAHYGSYLSLLPLAYLIALRFLSADVRLLVGCGLCVLPGVLSIPFLIEWASSRSKQARLEKVFRNADSEELLGYLASESNPGLGIVIRECGRRGETLFVPTLGNILRRHAGELDGVRAEAAAALLSIGSPEAREMLMAVAEEEEKKSVRNAAVIEIIKNGLHTRTGDDRDNADN